MFGGMCHDAYLLGVVDLHSVARDHGIGVSIVTIRNESLVQRGRNRIVAHFLASGASHLMFIDADIGFTARDVLRLVAHDRPIVGGTYRKKDPTKLDFAFVPMPTGVEVTEFGLVEVAALPGGFMCLRRDMVETLAAAHADRKYRVAPGERSIEPWEDHLYGLFECDICPETGAYWSEDYLFCERWRRAGGQVFLDPHISLEHHGTTLFTGDPTGIFQVAEQSA